MSALSIALICILGVAILISGYIFTISEFRHMADDPDKYSDINKEDQIKIIE